MKKLLFIFAIMALTACGSRVEVPPAHVGKILTKNGYAPETLPPSKFRLPWCMAYCDKLVILETSDNQLVEKLKIFMPADKLNITVDVRGTYSIPSATAQTDPLFDRLTSKNTNDGDVNIISATDVFNTYGVQAVRGVVRSELTKYSIADVLSQREAISANVHAAIAEKLRSTKTPIIISRFELADVQPPSVIVNAQEAAKEREIDIQKAEADAEVQLVEAERALEVAKKNRLVEREKAEAIAEQNKIAANSITPQLLAYRKLEVAERIYSELAKSNNTIIIPADSSGFSNLNDDAVLAKMLGREFNKK